MHAECFIDIRMDTFFINPYVSIILKQMWNLSACRVSDYFQYNLTFLLI